MNDEAEMREAIVHAVGLIPSFADAYLSHHESVIHRMRQVAYIMETDDYLSPAEVGAATNLSDPTPLQMLNRIRKALREADEVIEKMVLRLTPLLGKSLKE